MSSIYRSSPSKRSKAGVGSPASGGAGGGGSGSWTLWVQSLSTGTPTGPALERVARDSSSRARAKIATPSTGFVKQGRATIRSPARPITTSTSAIGARGRTLASATGATRTPATRRPSACLRTVTPRSLGLTTTPCGSSAWAPAAWRSSSSPGSSRRTAP